MMELTKEEQIEAIYDLKVGYTLGHADIAMLKSMARQLLAGLEQEPVADVVAWHHPTEERTCDIRLRRHDLAPGPLYAAPQLPQPVVDQKDVESLATDLMKRIDKITGERHSVATLSSMRVSIVEACRAAMLQGAEPPAYEIKRFGEFGANGLTRDDGELAISIQLFDFERGTTPQPVRGGGIVEKYALQAIINALQQQCDRLSDAPIPVIWPAVPQQGVM